MILVGGINCVNFKLFFRYFSTKLIIFHLIFSKISNQFDFLLNYYFIISYKLFFHWFIKDSTRRRSILKNTTPLVFNEVVGGEGA